ncbi:MAG: peptidoglycan editing factor PgeF [Deltaproteobacteria bacterium]
MRIIEGISYLSSPSIESAGVVHAFLSRRGGVSSPPFDTLNFDPRDTDTSQNIRENIRRISRAFNIKGERLVTVNQVHGGSVHLVTEKNLGITPPDADAIITNLKSIPIGIMTADCLPILIYDPVNHAIGAAHGGWKGTALGVAMRTLEAMEASFGTRAKDVSVALGPHIGPCCYHVKENVIDEFEKAFGDTSAYVKKTEGGFTLDLSGATFAQLTEAGVAPGNITALCPCTACNNNDFFSYRKDGGRTGRQLSFITL